MQAVLKNMENLEIGKIDIDNSLFGGPIDRTDILHRVVHWQMSKFRSGCHKVKGRSEVAGSTRKIYRQKGTGQARHGAITAPIFVGGGIVFGPLVRSHGYRLNKKVKKLGLKVALSLKYSENSIIFLDSIDLKEIKSSVLESKLNKMGVSSVLIIDYKPDESLVKSSANLRGVDVLSSDGLNVKDLLKHKSIIITRSAVEKIQERLA
jgi:large subunit ribosomal protein L4